MLLFVLNDIINIRLYILGMPITIRNLKITHFVLSFIGTDPRDNYVELTLLSYLDVFEET